MLEFCNVSKIHHSDIDKERFSALRDLFWRHRENVQPKDGEILALKNISFSVKKGVPFLILGSLGAGKTTIARLACGLSQPSSGVVKVDGTARLVIRKGISLTPFMSFKHYIQLLSMSYGADSKDLSRICDRILKMDTFKDFANSNIKKIPNDALKELNYYLALFIDADVYVFDETFSYDNPSLEPLYKERLDEIIESRTALILVGKVKAARSFNSFIEKVMVLDKGRSIYCGDFERAAISYAKSIETAPSFTEGLKP